MALTNEQIEKVFTDVMAHWSQLREPTFISKADLRAAIVDFDQALDDNQPTINSWFPQPGRSSLTGKQKLEIMLRLLEGRR